MAELLTLQQSLAVTAKHPLTVTDFARMAEVGILGEDDKIELIEGELIDMAPMGPGHLGAVAWLTKTLVGAEADKSIGKRAKFNPSERPLPAAARSRSSQGSR